MDGRDGTFAERILDSLDRIALANEELIRLAKDDRDLGDAIEAQPPPLLCPRCQTLDPSVEIELFGRGKLSEFVFAARCESCREAFYVVPQGYDLTANVHEAERLSKRKDSSLVSS
jgi:hypothetical protein